MIAAPLVIRGVARRAGGRAGAALVGLVLVATASAGCGGTENAASSQPRTSTLHATLADRDGDGFLEPAGGEPFVDRGPRARVGRTIARFGQLTDTHVRDEESPARVPFLDRLGPPFNSTFRPHEALSPQVLDAAVRALGRERPQAVVVTGDIVDSAQENELDQALAVLEGGVVQPDSGGRGYAGVQEAGSPDPFYFRPDHDAPRHPGILAAAQRRFRARGLDAPWYPAIGNHDVLVQGEVPATPAIDEVATGGELVTGFNPGFEPPTSESDASAVVDDLLTSGRAFGRTERVPADPGRRHLAPDEVVGRLAAAAGVEPTTSSRLDYTFDIGAEVRGIVLDTANRTGGSRGVVSPAQVEWLRAELARGGNRWVVVFAHNPLESSDGGEAALAALDAAPNVVAVVAGNRHHNTIETRDGYWLIGTSSLADFPQQARMFCLRETGTGVALETWMVDHDGRGLAGTARELAYLDAQGGRPQGFGGRREDRNARLFVPR
jgi:3',5'-cyclic AMP phosphodiesterase CpdA